MTVGRLRAGGQRTMAAVAAMVVLASCAVSSAATSTPGAHATPSMRRFVDPAEGLSQAVVYGDLVFTSGHLPLQEAETAPFADQVEAALDNVEATLRKAGAGFDTVIQVNVYLLDFDDWPTFNEIYTRRVGTSGLPARTTVDVERLGWGRIEIEMIAHVRAP